MTASLRLRIALSATVAAGAFGWAGAAMAEEAAADAPAIIVYGRPDGYDLDKTPTATKIGRAHV